MAERREANWLRWRAHLAFPESRSSPKHLPPIRQLRRSKLPDEIALIERGVHGCEAAYAAARAAVGPGRTEWTRMSIFTPRPPGPWASRSANSETIFRPEHPADRLAIARCRRANCFPSIFPWSFAVTGRIFVPHFLRRRPADGCTISDSHRRAADALGYVESTVRPGTNCRQLYLDVANQLKNPRGRVFPHHLGHGIGLSADEAPRLNPHWDDVFQEGDVFTAEPGLYAEELRGGVRLEKDYLVTAEGVRPLSGFPLDL